ncbi:MAG: hypothetical protein A2287_07345 [Candidatus Melainabacteria bacterium RIFOXYA12_FULL_32_12]|nr:MAG: hypothetical protein A2255_02110 [Candidatus Melainabacteria bacterium RIFOXYA2_FULL_32_9]OGI30402.1 MAG: hypothetical protein A2287_07345 [Candidatus Melainabacteria bacterium RIFOXYA12_FULL_32_12]
MIYGLLSIIVGVAVTYIILNIGQQEESSPIARLSKIKSQNPIMAEMEKVEINELIKDSEYKFQALGEFLCRFNFFNLLKKQLKIADINLKADVFIMISVIPALLCFILGTLNPAGFFVYLILAVLAAAFPTVMVKMRIKKRYNMFTSQFPDALDLISSSLRAGHSLLSAFQMVSKEMPEPVNQIFKVASDDISLGRDTRDALEGMADNLPMSIDLRFFITAVLIQREIGGNLAEILDTLNYTIRERFKLLGQIATQTAQAKLSGLVLAIAPFAIGGIIWSMNPTYLEPLFKTLPGQIALVVAVMMAGMGYVIINKITDIRV